MPFIPKKIKQRFLNTKVFEDVKQFGFTDIQANIVAGRAGESVDELEQILFTALKNLHHPKLLKDCRKASKRIIDSVRNDEKIGILTDYDVDGICSHVVVYYSLLLFGVRQKKIESLIGHRMTDGYGVSSNLVNKILDLQEKPELIITADCGTSDEEKIKKLKKGGIEVIVTDHHAVPQEGVPGSAFATINPMQNDCAYPDKYISGCMVSWLLMCQIRNDLIEKNFLDENTPKLGGLLDFVSLSTVADAVSLFSATNRAVVKSGLQVINKKQRPCWKAMRKLVGKGESGLFSVEDLGFQIAPRINARSRMADPYAALYFFLSENEEKAAHYLGKLEQCNDERKATEQTMNQKAHTYAHKLHAAQKNSIVIADQDFHAGVQGIVASRIVDSFGKPTIVMSPISGGEVLSGSARSIDGIHIRNMLQEVDTAEPGLLLSYGGHRGAAGLKIRAADFDTFSDLFEKAISAHTGDKKLLPIILTDGVLNNELMTLATVSEIEKLLPFGREFEEPVFEGVFKVSQSKFVGADPVHLSLQLEKEGKSYKGIWFRAVQKHGDESPINCGNTVKCAYKLKLNEFRGRQSLQIFVEYAELV